MNKNDLYNFRYIKKEIARLNKRIAELNAKAEKVTAGSGGGFGGGVSDKVGNNAAKIADLRTKIEKYKDRLIESEFATMCFLEQINDARLRVIIELFFIDCKSWRGVAAELGGDDTEDSCKQYFHRKFDELEN